MTIAVGGSRRRGIIRGCELPKRARFAAKATAEAQTTQNQSRKSNKRYGKGVNLYTGIGRLEFFLKALISRQVFIIYAPRPTDLLQNTMLETQTKQRQPHESNKRFGKVGNLHQGEGRLAFLHQRKFHGKPL